MPSTHFENLHRILTLYYDLIERSNSLALQNEATTAENFFCVFLSKSFGWNLENANQESLNQSGFDLVDFDKGVAVQVTSNKKYSVKRKLTIESFEKSRDRRIKRVIILFTAKKCPDKVLAVEKKHGITFEGWDLGKLLKKIFYANKLPDEQKVLNGIAESMIHPDIFNGAFPMSDASMAEGSFLLQPVVVRKNGIYIDRSVLVQALFAFAQVNHGLLIGGPGYGKSIILTELQSLCQKKRIPCYLIKINELIEGSDAEISEELSTGGQWLAALNRLNFEQHVGKGILIFDAFDTAKEETLKQRVLKHIRKAQEKLGDKWHVIASVRTFEASHSFQLRELFAQPVSSGKTAARIFSIPMLNDSELDAALKQKPKLKSLAAAQSLSLRQLLSIPYFLKLFEQVAENIPVGKGKIRVSIESEHQLLEMYWSSAVEQTGDELFLRKLTRELVESESLSCPKLQVVNENNLIYYERLVSTGVITESSASRQNISFSHNILLEFAVAKFIVPDSAENVVKYLLENEKVPFLFRQSFIYYYSRLWSSDQRHFWKHYQAIRAVETALYRLVHQTILNYVVCIYFNTVDELAPILNHPDENTRGSSLRKMLEAIRFISKGTPREKDTALLAKASIQMHIHCVWEMGFLLNQAIKYFLEKKDATVLRTLSKASVQYMQFILVERMNDANKFSAERNGGTWAIQNMLLCFSYQQSAAKRLLTKVLEVLSIPGFPIYWFYTLSDGIDNVAKHDVAFAVKLYKAIYLHHENSSEETLLASSVVMALRSNRRQDYEGVHHHLEASFGNLLEKHPNDFLPVGLQMLNRLSSRPEYYTAWDKAMPMQIGKVNTKIIPDFNFYDNDTDKQYGPASHLEKIIDYLQKLIEQGKHKYAVEMMRLALQYAETSLIWRKLLDILAIHAHLFRKISMEVLVNIPVYICSETVHEAGELITAIWPFLNDLEKRKLEKVVLSILKAKYVKNDREFVNHRVIRLLSCIGQSSLYYEESKEILVQHGIKENKPLLERSRLMPYHPTEEEQMERAGVDREDATQVVLYENLKKIQQFNGLHDNSKVKPGRESYVELEAIATSLYEMARDPKCNGKFRMQVDDAVSGFFAIVARNGSRLGVKLRRKIITIARFYLDSPLYIPEAYEISENGSNSFGYSPNPRIEATDILAALMNSGKADEVVDILLDLMTDHSIAVRYHSIKHLYSLWKIKPKELWARLFVACCMEQEGFLLQRIIQYLTWDEIVNDNQKNVESCLLFLEGRFQKMEKADHRLWNDYILLLLHMVIRKNSSTAQEIIDRNISLPTFSKHTIFQISNEIDPHSITNKYSTDPQRNEYFFSLWMEILRHRFAVINSKGLVNNEIGDDLEVIDKTIEQLYYTTLTGKKSNRNKPVEKDNLKAFYFRTKPMLQYIVDESEKLGSGFMVAHTGYHFIQLLNLFFEIDTAFVLQIASRIVRCASANGFTYDGTTLGEIVKLTERMLADHKDLLADPANFNSLIQILDLFANSGWQEALELTWRLKEIF